MRKWVRIASLVLVVTMVAGTSGSASGIDSCRVLDFNDDGFLNFSDVNVLVAAFGLPDPRVDVDGSGLVDQADVIFLLTFLELGCSGCNANLDDTDGLSVVDAADREALEAAYGTDCRGDLNRDGTVDNDRDVELLVEYFGKPTGPDQPATRADFNGDGSVSLADIAPFGAMIGNDCRADLNFDGAVDTNDLWALLSSWGSCS